MSNDNTNLPFCQGEVLADKSATGKSRNWKLHKHNSAYIALAYEDVDTHKSERIRSCADYLAFVRGEDGRLKLHDARFCRVRLCPICQWRRSLKTFAQMSQVIDVAASEGYSFIFLTLTLRNCAPADLSATITSTLQSFNRFTKYKDFMCAFKGFYRGFEITYNMKDDTYHPHIHCVLAVNKSYFTSRNYLSQKALTDLWKKALKADYDPIIDIRKCFGGSKSIAEACKYAVKPSDIICEDWDLTVEQVRVLDEALNRRRFIGLGGIFKDIHKRLHLDDMEDGDLAHIETQAEGDVDENVILYFWNGFNYYKGELS